VIYPEHIQCLSRKHWTSLEIAKIAGDFLAQPGSTVLDIGSGVGKFCLSAGHRHPDTLFYGVEQRLDLVHLAEKAQQEMTLPNVQFIHANITQINFKEFDHFYYYNSFYENIDQLNRIDDTIETSIDLYLYYIQYLYVVLQEKPIGTRLVTYQSLEHEIPPGYKVMGTAKGKLVKMWIKKS
jgi:hypothetical protein